MAQHDSESAGMEENQLQDHVFKAFRRKSLKKWSRDCRQARQVLCHKPMNNKEWQTIEERRRAYLAASPLEREKILERLLQETFQDGDNLPEAALLNLAVLFASDRDTFVKIQFQKYLENYEKGVLFSPQKIHHLCGLLVRLDERSGEPEARHESHLLLDFMLDAMEALQLDEQKYESTGRWAPQSSLFEDLRNLALAKSQDSRNYLLSRKWQDLYEMTMQDALEKPDTLHGVAGGSTDTAIYTYDHAQQNYNLRVQYQQYDETPIRCPLLPIAEGLLAKYDWGTVKKIYRVPPKAPAPIQLSDSP